MQELKAFTAVGKLDTPCGGFFVSTDLKNVLRKGIEAAREHKFFVADAQSGAGATLAMNALKAALVKDSRTAIIELSPYPLTSQKGICRMIFSEVLMGLGELPVYRWLDYVTVKGKRRKGRHSQMRDTLTRLYAQGKSVLVLMDNALSQPRYAWQLLYNMAGLNKDNQRYGPGVMITANLHDKVARYKPEEIVVEGKLGFPPMARRVSFALSGLTAAEVAPYLRFQAARDGAAFTTGFLAALKAHLAEPWLVESGKHRFPGTVNAVGRNLMEEYYKLGKDFYASAPRRVESRPRVAAGVEK